MKKKIVSKVFAYCWQHVQCFPHVEMKAVIRA